MAGFSEVRKNTYLHKGTHKNSTCWAVEGVLVASCHFQIVEEYEVCVVEETLIDGRDEF